jgi:hypothetical protein
LIDIRVLHLPVALFAVPLLSEVGLLQGHVVYDGHQTLGLLVAISQDSRLEQELLEPDKHPAFLESLGLDTLGVDLRKLLKVCLLEDALDLGVD